MFPTVKIDDKEPVGSLRLPPLSKPSSSHLSVSNRSGIDGKVEAGFTPHPPPASTKPKLVSLMKPCGPRTKPTNDWIFQRHLLRTGRVDSVPFWSQRVSVRQPATQHRVDAATQRLLQSRRQRELFRKKLVDLIFCEEAGPSEEKRTDGQYLTTLEKRKLRYYYYIHNGINTDHVAPLAESWLENVLHLVPDHLKANYPSAVSNLCLEIKNEYLFCVKKAIIDFVFGDSTRKRMLQNDNTNDADEKRKLVTTSVILLRSMRSTKTILLKRLHATHPCFQKIQALWCTKYHDFVMIDVQHFLSAQSPWELPTFIQTISHQIEKAKMVLTNEWLETILNLLRGGKRCSVLVTIKKGQHQSFLEAVATIMSNQLQLICLKSLKKVTAFLTLSDIVIAPRHPGFVLHLLLEDNNIHFEPNIDAYETAFLSILDALVTTGNSVPRIDQRVFPELGIDNTVSNLKPIILDEIIVRSKREISETVLNGSIGPREHARLYDKYEFIINQQINSDVSKFLEEDHTFLEYVDRVEFFCDLGREISADMISTVRHGLFEVRCNNLIQDLVQRTELARERLLTKMTKDQQTLCSNLCGEYETIAEKASSIPIDTAQLINLKNYIDEIESIHLLHLEEILSDVCNQITFLIDYVNLSPAEMRQNREAFTWYSRLPGIIKRSKQTIVEKRQEFEEALRLNRHSFTEELEDYAQRVEQFSTYGDKNEMLTYFSRAEELNAQLESCEEKIHLFNAEEVAFNWPQTEYPLKKQTLDQLSPYLRLYETSIKFEEKQKEWLASPLTTINPDAVEQQIVDIWKSIFKLERIFTDVPLTKAMAQKVKNKVETLKEHIPLVQSLCNPGLRERHWEQIGELVGFPLKADQETTLAKIIELNLDEYVGRFEAISEAASKEHNLEKSMQKMMKEWETIEFCIIPYRETATYILSSIDDIQQLLDDQIIKTQAIKSSPFVKPFENEIIKWETKLCRLQEIIDEWLKVQTTWMYLEPIFTSPDIMSQMPEEGRRFNTVDKHWRDIMKAAVLDKHVLTVLMIERILERLKKSNTLLELIQKGLNDYLEKKRLCFPRFFFLSNDELLEILAETKDPTRVQPHLRKCFEGICSLQFEDEMEVTHIVSVDGESIELNRHIQTMKARGQVELWLLELENSMLTSVRKMIGDASDSYTTTQSDKWILEWPGQAVLCVSQLMWTTEVQEILQSGSKVRLKEYLKQSNDRIDEVVSIVRKPLSNLTRITLESLVVLDVHARDIVASFIDNDVNSVADFHWLSQLRYYMEEDSLMVRMIHGALKYGYEYLGNTGRLVMTPLTDRCYRTLFSALRLHLGCALEGPAGTGKTETTKDLAKAVAKHCIVFNCSDSMDYISLAKFFKGLSACGAWSCFDEFNRIDLEVLSVVAQQILTIQRGILSNAETLMIGGTEVKLDPTCAVFVTMNPGYAGRSDLPDNLKALFRPVAMMVPDYAMIAEIALYSYGFNKARQLANKIVSVYRLCAENLSLQCHYDYGMRAIKSVLRAVGLLKVEHPTEDEDILVLRAIRNVNLPKFLPMDVPLFNAITMDLFPDVSFSETNYSIFDEEVRRVCKNMNLDCTDYFLEKIHEMYETMAFRHGLMIVGGPFGGKTSVYKVLAETLGRLHARKQMNENKVWITVINPKALTMGKLYGQFEQLSHEWTDGVLAVTFRNYATSTSPDRKWIVFDGPVDALWIENLNTVLDDNKKLCLMSGEVIQLTPSMNIIFETLDLENASPATVSRCGMIYMEPQLLGWKPLIVSWLQSWPPLLKPAHKDIVRQLFDHFCPPLLHFLRHAGIKDLCPSTDTSLICSLSRLMDCYLEELRDEGSFKILSSEEVFAIITGSFLFACVWSIGASIDESSRVMFSDVFRMLMKGIVPEEYTKYKNKPELVDYSAFAEHILVIPDEDLVYDYNFIVEGGCRWVKWTENLKNTPAIPRDICSHEIIIPTLDTIRYTALMSMLVTHRKPVLFVGPPGTGKTMFITDFLKNKLKFTDFKSCVFNFSARLGPAQAQDFIMSKLDKRRKGIYGPPMGKNMVLFIDDLSSPVPEAYGAQPPIELIRQWLDHNTWYDAKDNGPLKIVDVQIIAAMTPTGGGRNGITPRLLQHFNIISVNEYSKETMKTIFGKIMLWHLDTRGFSKEFDPGIEQLVDGTLRIHGAALANLLPTPSKSHYVFNVRDVARVMQGVLFSVPETMEDLKALKRLWTHEVLRVYYDRLVDAKEKSWLFQQLIDVIQTTLKEDFNLMFNHLATGTDAKVLEDDLRSLVFCDFSDPKSDVRNYIEVPDVDELQSVVDGYLDEYNNVSKKPMNIVMFKYAVEHLSHISRILRQPQGHALLVGVGGSGRQSLARLVAHMSDCELHQLEITRSYALADWKDDLKHIFTKTVTDEKHHIFLLADTQIKDECFLDDINNLLNVGEVPNLFSAEEKQEISEKMREIDRQREKPLNPDGDQASMFGLFVRAIREQLHVVLAMSPAGDSFRDRLRKFPSLISCCAVDWFQPWPEDALQAVANKFLSTMQLDDSEVEKCTVLCQALHSSVMELSDTFFDEMKRRTYTTPASYLGLLSTFKKLLGEQREEVSKAKKRYELGIDKLDLASTQVIAMQSELSQLQPQLIEASKEVDDVMAAVEKESIQVADVEKVVKTEEEQANEQARSSQKIKEECDGELSKAIPILDAAMEALNTLTNNDITIVKTMKNPPSGVKLVMESICILKGVKSDRITDPFGSGKMIEDYWGPSKKMLGDMKFLESLTNFDKDNIPAKNMKIIREKYTDNPDFDPDKIKSASAAAEGLCKWVIALEAYDRVIKDVAPKKEALLVAEAELAVAQHSLKDKQAALKEVQAKLQELTDMLDKNKRHKMELETQVDQCTLKLERAQQLLSRLGGERTRWSEMAVQLGERYLFLTGDMLVASGIIAYLGPFTASYRRCQIEIWLDTCKSIGLLCSPNFSLSTTLGDPVTIQAWKIAELPVDSFSVDSAIIIKKSNRWPLLIDPQNQANRWIRNMEKSSGLKIIKPSDLDYLRTIEICIQTGKPVLLENVGEDVDPALDSVLLKQTFRHSGTMCIKIGDNVVEYSQSFRLYVTSNLSNPHYLPETTMKITLVNFMITPSGLEDQLLGLVVAREKPDLEEERRALIVQGADNKRQLKEIEDKILEVLSDSKGNILDDETAIKVLSSSKILANEITQKQTNAEVTERKIESSRQGYYPISVYASSVFFTVASLSSLDHMYHYSLPWFVHLFVASIDNTEKFDELDLRLTCLKDYFIILVHENVCRGLFQKDKFLFTFLLTVNQLQIDGKISDSEWQFLLTGGVNLTTVQSPSPLHWLSQTTWDILCSLDELDHFQGLKGSVIEAQSVWKKFCESDEVGDVPLPLNWENQLNNFQKLLVLRCLCPYKVIDFIQKRISETLGPNFVDAPPFDLDKAFAASSCCSPVIFLLTPGVDPITSLLKFAEEMGFGGPRLNTLSLGQGQGPIAMELVQEAAKVGLWVVLQNCHLAKSWMPSLEKLCEELSPDNTHPDFRLWLTTYSCSYFPMAVLQSSVKVTDEALTGLKASMMRSYLGDPIANPDVFYGCRIQQVAFQKLLFGLCCFHTMVQERRNFGSIGWNVPYQFSETDLHASIQHLTAFLTEMDCKTIPLAALQYTTGVCTYGGRITDSWDVRTLNALLDRFFTSSFLDSTTVTLGSHILLLPTDAKYESYVEMLKTLPTTTSPEVVGLHPNASIATAKSNTNALLQDLLSTQLGAMQQSRGRSKVSQSMDEVALVLVVNIMSKLPEEFNLDAARQRYPPSYDNSMNTVLVQEMSRYNVMLKTIRQSLQKVEQALQGLIVLSSDLEQVVSAMVRGKVPDVWLSKSYPSVKSLNSYVQDFLKRLKFLKGWFDNGTPVVFWMSGMYFVRAFLTAIQQSYARKHQISIDHLELHCTIMDSDVSNNFSSTPSEGVYIEGLFLEGARWNRSLKMLDESLPKQLIDKLPVMWLKPSLKTSASNIDDVTRKNSMYLCPVYQTRQRWGSLSTTGHSSNFVLTLDLPTKETEEHWTRRGVAMLCQLDD